MNYPIFTDIKIFRNTTTLGYYIVGITSSNTKYVIDALGRCSKVGCSSEQIVFFSSKMKAEEFIEDNLSGDTF